MLAVESTAVVIIDVQERLMRVMHERERLIGELQRLIAGVQALGLPLIMTEQNPGGLGRTIPEVAQFLPDCQPIAKLSFSCLGEGPFMQRLTAMARRQLLLAGIESHVCVYQTAADLVAAGYEVQVVADGVSSRTAQNREIGLERARAVGAGITSVETALFELLRVAEGDVFREISRIVR